MIGTGVLKWWMMKTEKYHHVLIHLLTPPGKHLIGSSFIFRQRCQTQSQCGEHYQSPDVSVAWQNVTKGRNIQKRALNVLQKPGELSLKILKDITGSSSESSGWKAAVTQTKCLLYKKKREALSTVATTRQIKTPKKGTCCNNTFSN